MADLENKVILVTGGASGLGEAIVTAAAAVGARVAIVGLALDAVQAAAERHPGARGYQADVAEPGAMDRVCAEVVADFGRLDGAVNNAGISGALGPMLESTLDNWNSVIGVNLTGVYLSARAEIPHMLRNGGGSIVNMSSMAGVGGEPGLSAYCASKHGVVGLTKCIALEYGAQQIRCNAVCPSYVKTPMTLAGTPDEMWPQLEALHPIGRLVTAEEVAHATIFLLSAKSGGMTGSTHLLDGGVAAR